MGDVVFERAQEPLGVARRDDDAGANPSPWSARLHVHEVEGEFGVGVVQEHQVAIGPLGRGVVKLDLEL